MLNELETRLAREIPAGADPRIIAARELLGAHHQPLVMAPGDLRPLLSRHQRGLAGCSMSSGRRLGGDHAVRDRRQAGGVSQAA